MASHLWLPIILEWTDQQLLILFMQITELSGYASRVSEMFAVFDDLQKGHCIRNVNSSGQEQNVATQEMGNSIGHGAVVDVNQMPGGEMVDTQDTIILKDVAIITPCGDVVVTSLSFEVQFSVALQYCLIIAWRTTQSCLVLKNSWQPHFLAHFFFSHLLWAISNSVLNTPLSRTVSRSP